MARTAGDARGILAAVRQVVRNVAPNRAVFGVKTVEEVVAGSLDTPRLSAQVLALFAATALPLAAVGLYSLVMLAVIVLNTKPMQSLLFGVRLADGVTVASVIAALAVVAVTAAFAPARRAAAIDPIQALREE